MSKYCISRRCFLGTAAASTFYRFPGNLFAAEKMSDVILRFAVTSDVHYPGPAAQNVYPGNSQTVQEYRYAKLLSFMNHYSASQPYPKFDAILVCGDMSNRGLPEEIVPFRDTMDKHLSQDTRRVLCMGSHEYMGGNKKLWEETFRTSADSHQVIGGFHFIALSPDDTNEHDGVFANKLDWVAKELKAAAADAPDKPIFFIQHYHVAKPVSKQTTQGTPQWLRGRCTVRSHVNNWGASDLFELFQSYPQIVDFSGHSHYPISDSGAAWQGNFTAFGAGTLCYAKMLEEPYETAPRGRFEYAQFYVVEVKRDYSVRLRIFDLYSNSFLDREYRVQPGIIDTYLYTDDRIEKSTPPFWNEGASLKADVVHSAGATLHFPQAVDPSDIQSYRITVERNENNTATPAAERLVWSEFYFKDPPRGFSIPINGLAPNKEYKAYVHAVSFFNQESKSALETVFKTKDV